MTKQASNSSTDQGGGKRRFVMNRTFNVAVASRSIRMFVAMEIAILREKAALCLRVARRLSWNNPGRLELTELAQRLDQQARDLELQTASAASAAPIFLIIASNGANKGGGKRRRPGNGAIGLPPYCGGGKRRGEGCFLICRNRARS